jgi:hypothetical protein
VPEIQEIKLKNGGMVPEPLVQVLTVTLSRMLAGQVDGLQGMLSAYDLRELCRNPEYLIGDVSLALLKRLALVEPDGSIHECVRDVALSGIVGESLDIHWEDPVA